MGSIRTLLALAVVLAHSPPTLSGAPIFGGGRNAVQLFYLISGFLITHVLKNNKAYANPLKFYANRALRLYPLYYVVAASALLLDWVAYPNFFQLYRDVPAAARALLILSNATIFGQDWVMFSAVRHGQWMLSTNFRDSDFPLYEGLLIPPAWTLGVELTFYLIAPFAVRNIKILTTLLLLSVATRLWIFHLGLGTQDPWTYRFFPAELSLFLLGSLSNQYLLPHWQRIAAIAVRFRVVHYATFLLILALVLFSVIPLGGIIKTPSLFLLFFLLLPLAFIYQNSSKLDRAIGELSYPIYVSHFFVISLTASVASAMHWRETLIVKAILNLVLVVACAYLLNKIVAKKIEAIRARIRTS